MTQIRSSYFKDCITTANQPFASSSSIRQMCSVISSFSSAQTQRAILHLRRECLHESLAPQMEHTLLLDMFLRRKTSFDEREHLASLHRNTRTLEGTLIPSNIDHSFCIAFLSEIPPRSSQRLMVCPYAERTEKRSCFSKYEAQKSCCHLVPIEWDTCDHNHIRRCKEFH